MARLIDADALLVKQANIAKTFARSDAQKSLMGRVMYNTQQAPTIEAIPVEWLREWEDEVGTLNEWWPIIERIITVWQEEQEAK